MGFIGHASIDENGKVTGGKEGDQTGREIRIQEWYSKPWNKYLYCTDREMSLAAGAFMRRVCECDNFGYSQGKRWDGHYNIVAHDRHVEGAKGDYDCSSLILSCYILAGLDIKPEGYTGNMAQILLNTGKFVCETRSEYLTSDKYSRVGGIYLKEGSHVVMSLSDNIKTFDDDPEPTPEPTPIKQTEPAQNLDKSIAGLYAVTAPLNIRYGPGTEYIPMTVIPKGEVVRNYGYYTEVKGIKWYLVKYGSLTGYCSSLYLRK